MHEARQWDIRTGPGITALGIAATRALESQRPDRLVDDPYAAAFVAAVPSSIPTGLRWPQAGAAVSEVEAFFMQSTRYIGVRTRFFDDVLTAACREGCEQVVILAAGLDSRAYRLEWPPGVRLFEIDQPDVLAFKNQVLDSQGAVAACVRYTVGINLQDDWPAALRGAGFDPSVPTAWLAEGLLMYLPAQAEARLYAGIHDMSAPGSQLSVEHQAEPGILKRSSQELDAIRQVSPADGQLLQSDARPSAGRWLTDHGWSAINQTSTAVAQRYGRQPHRAGGQQRTGTGHDDGRGHGVPVRPSRRLTPYTTRPPPRRGRHVPDSGRSPANATPSMTSRYPLISVRRSCQAFGWVDRSSSVPA